MTTIDKLDIAIHVQYARRTQFIEEVNEEYRLQEANFVQPQIQVIDLYPRISEMDLLLGIIARHTPWAYFYPPKQFNSQRRSPFAFHRVVPSLGSTKDQEEDTAKAEAQVCNTTEEKEEKKIILAFFKTIDEINDLIGFVIGRVGQFLQG
jgi:hypothetical protein